MQFLAVAALFATAAVAVPFNSHARATPAFAFQNGTVTNPLPPSSSGFFACRPGAYRCSEDLTGWEVCSTQGKYVSGGDCAGALCELDSNTAAPFCV
jgi:hypothetical protein